MSFLSFSAIIIFLEQHVRLPHTCAPERSIYLTGNRENFRSNKKSPVLHYIIQGTYVLRGSTLVIRHPVTCPPPGQPKQNPQISHSMVTESPDRIGVARSWSSTASGKDARSICISLCCRLAIYSSLQRFFLFHCYSSTILFKCKAFLCIFSTAVFVFLAGATRARIITSDFLSNDNSTGFLLL